MPEQDYKKWFEQQTRGGGPPVLLEPPGPTATPQQASEAAAGVDLRPILGRVANAAGGAYSGAQMGKLFGGTGALIGGVGGAGLGAMLNSDEPFTDLGALAGDAITNRFLPPGSSRLARFLGGTAATTVGAVLGNVADKQADFTADTEWGKIGVYSGLTATSLAMEAAVKGLHPTKAFEYSQELKALLGEKASHPLSFTEATGVGRRLQQQMLSGTSRGVALAGEQADWQRRAFDKILNLSPAKAPSIVEEGLESQKSAKSLADTFVETKTTKQGVHSQMRWDKLQKQFNLSNEELTYFKSTIKTAPEEFIDSFLHNEQTQMKGLYALRALNKTLTPEEFAPLGNALVMRVLDRSKAFNALDKQGNLILDGAKFRDALFNEFGAERLAYAIGPERAEALYKLSLIMEETDVLKKMNELPTTALGRAINYVSNKGLYVIAGMGAGGMAGAQFGGSTMAGVAGGMALGTSVAVGVSYVINRFMASPEIAELLLTASKANADPTVVNAAIRALFSNSQAEERPASRPATRLNLDPFLAGR